VVNNKVHGADNLVYNAELSYFRSRRAKRRNGLGGDADAVENHALPTGPPGPAARFFVSQGAGARRNDSNIFHGPHKPALESTVMRQKGEGQGGGLGWLAYAGAPP